ncbi:MAG TPA: XdhC family protein [Ktedonobacterales bacterium]|jgi:xanthine dehydrogenase accessory factor|nr:XdhC family protein [Ktedonobacterales bacterium]
MREDILAQAQRLRAEGRAFALATVVAARQPTSGAPGARAIILPDGRLDGWVGGHCAQPTVIRQGLEALADGSARLVVLSPDTSEPGASRDGVVRDGVARVPMLCGSQGELQVFVEPFLPRPTVVVVGSSVVARTLAQLATTLDFEAWVCDPLAEMQTFPNADRLVPTLDALAPQLSERSYVIVATIGEYDEEAALVAVESPASYVGLVASNKRLSAVRAYLIEQGVTRERAEHLRRAKGLPGFVIKPEEIAFSVMAELIEARRQRVGLMSAVAQQTPVRAEATDPICGMTVDIATARYTVERDGETFYFCCSGCKRTFEKQHALSRRQ